MKLEPKHVDFVDHAKLCRVDISHDDFRILAGDDPENIENLLSKQSEPQIQDHLTAILDQTIAKVDKKIWSSYCDQVKLESRVSEIPSLEYKDEKLRLTCRCLGFNDADKMVPVSATGKQDLKSFVS